jgi:hypothetical protein
VSVLAGRKKVRKGKDGLDDVRQDLDAGSLDTDDPGRGRSIASTGEEALVVRGNDEGHPEKWEKGQFRWEGRERRVRRT